MKTILCIEVGRVRRIPKVAATLKRNKRRYDRFFHLKLAEPQVILPVSRKQINQILQRKTEPWCVGWIGDGSIYLLSPEKYLTESSHTRKSRYWKVLAHEHAHLYIRALGKGNIPRWMNEGLASWLAGQRHRTPTWEEAMTVIGPWPEFSHSVYLVGYYWVDRLIQKYGQQKLISIIREMGKHKSSSAFPRVFKSVYGTPWTKRSVQKLYR
ncbi:MAG: hypothetical protein V1685_03675 [Parcubacteria group bacterium]